MCVALLPMAACGRSAGGAAPEGVRAAVERYDRAIGEKDATALRSLTADRFVYFTSSGQSRERDRFIGFLTSSEYRPEHRERTELDVRIVGGTAVVGSRWRGWGTYAGNPFDDDQRCTLVFSRVGSGWRLVSEHCTPVAGPEPLATRRP